MRIGEGRSIQYGQFIPVNKKRKKVETHANLKETEIWTFEEFGADYTMAVICQVQYVREET